jgi:ABC-type dipeptide/oligopeptide/nickel transport system permease component
MKMKQKISVITLVTGIIGISMLLAFVGIMVWWVRALPLIIIFAVCIALLVYDFVRTLLYGEEGTR